MCAPSPRPTSASSAPGFLGLLPGGRRGLWREGWLPDSAPRMALAKALWGWGGKETRRWRVSRRMLRRQGGAPGADPSLEVSPGSLTDAALESWGERSTVVLNTV